MFLKEAKTYRIVQSEDVVRVIFDLHGDEFSQLPKVRT